MIDNGLRTFAFHTGQRRQVAAALDASVEGQAAGPALNLDPETAAQMYVQQTLASPQIPEFTAQKVRGQFPEFKSLGVEKIPLTGALNESYSDIFGVLITNFAEPDRTKWNWTIGAAVNAGGVPVRDLQDPGKHGQPEHMSQYEADVRNNQVPANDNGGVHRYSGIHNKAFANLALARDPNDGRKFLIDNEPLAALFYLALTQHLSRTSGFSDSRRAAPCWPGWACPWSTGPHVNCENRGRSCLMTLRAESFPPAFFPPTPGS